MTGRTISKNPMACDTDIAVHSPHSPQNHETVKESTRQKTMGSRHGVAAGR